jgi:osmotically-inducible protein OsmY
MSSEPRPATGRSWPRTAATGRWDVWITLAVRIGLFRSGMAGLRACTQDGSVTLHGKVPTRTHRARAESVARSVRGVKDVWSLLQVVPDPRRSTVDASDATVRTAVGAAQDRRGRGVRVIAVDDGVVLLGGSVSSEHERSQVVEMARRCTGVREVASLIVVSAT